jgi:hypothetical protein
MSDREMIPTSLPLAVTGTGWMFFSSRTLHDLLHGRFSVHGRDLPRQDVLGKRGLQCLSSTQDGSDQVELGDDPDYVPVTLSDWNPLNSPMRSWIATSRAVAVGVAATTGPRMMSGLHVSPPSSN